MFRTKFIKKLQNKKFAIAIPDDLVNRLQRFRAEERMYDESDTGYWRDKFNTKSYAKIEDELQSLIVKVENNTHGALSDFLAIQNNIFLGYHSMLGNYRYVPAPYILRLCFNHKVNGYFLEAMGLTNLLQGSAENQVLGFTQLQQAVTYGAKRANHWIKNIIEDFNIDILYQVLSIAMTHFYDIKPFAYPEIVKLIDSVEKLKKISDICASGLPIKEISIFMTLLHKILEIEPDFFRTSRQPLLQESTTAATLKTSSIYALSQYLISLHLNGMTDKQQEQKLKELIVAELAIKISKIKKDNCTDKDKSLLAHCRNLILYCVFLSYERRQIKNILVLLDVKNLELKTDYKTSNQLFFTPAKVVKSSKNFELKQMDSFKIL